MNYEDQLDRDLYGFEELVLFRRSTYSRCRRIIQSGQGTWLRVGWLSAAHLLVRGTSTWMRCDEIKMKVALKRTKSTRFR